MSVATMQELPETAQALIDARLETIERMLLGRVPRADRLAILRDVETQIMDQLLEREGEDLTREEVLEVLRALDPPEAFLPEGEGALALPAAPPVASSPRRALTPSPAAPKRTSAEQMGRLSGIFGIISLGLIIAIPLAYALAIIAGSEFVLIGGILGVCALMSLGGLTSFVLALVARVSTAWALVGLVTGIFATLISLFPALFLLFQLMG